MKRRTEIEGQTEATMKRQTERKDTDGGGIIRTRSKSPPYEVDKLKVES